MTAMQLALDCDPTWPTDCQPGDRTPTRFDCRQHEMWDLRGQHVDPAAYWTAQTIDPGSYL